MCNAAPQTSYEDVEQIIREELSVQELSEVFSEFDKTPIASASLAQVHRARLKSSGDEVAVKVQHRWIKERCAGDIRYNKFLSKVAKRAFPSF
jgi:aarF domain-containing kinase